MSTVAGTPLTLKKGEGREDEGEEEEEEEEKKKEKEKEEDNPIFPKMRDSYKDFRPRGRATEPTAIRDELTLNYHAKKDLSVDPHLPAGTPDSDGDILGVLDYSPDIMDETNHSGGPGQSPHRYIAYCHVFDSLHFAELMPHVFIRNQAVYVKVVDMEVVPATLNFFNQSVFTIILHHGSTHWTIIRRSRQLTSLHNQLRLFKTKLKLPAATSEERERRQSLRDQMKKRAATDATAATDGHEYNDHDEGGDLAVPAGDAGKTKRLVKFPRKSLQRLDAGTASHVETYLRNLLQHSLLRSHSAVLEFFEISPISFIHQLGPKLKEGFVKKRSGGAGPLLCCGGQYKRRWLVLRETCVFCVSPGGGTPRAVMLVDAAFQVSHGFRHTRTHKGLLVTNLSRSLVVKCDGDEDEKEWSKAIDFVRNNYASDFSQPNRHLSFAPVRKRSHARWYVDGSWFMSDVSDLLESAREEIFITDWWLSPDIYLKRPDLTGKQWKLSEILKRQASRGVKIFILLYKEVELALGLNSLYSKEALCALSPNIRVLRHPDHHKGALYWAHHEKVVVVDQMFAFVGGIDLCYGRWDDYRHKLVDVGHAGRVPPPKTSGSSLGRLIVGTHDLFLKGVSSISSTEEREKEREEGEGEVEGEGESSEYYSSAADDKGHPPPGKMTLTSIEDDVWVNEKETEVRPGGSSPVTSCSSTEDNYVTHDSSSGNRSDDEGDLKQDLKDDLKYDLKNDLKNDQTNDLKHSLKLDLKTDPDPKANHQGESLQILGGAKADPSSLKAPRRRVTRHLKSLGLDLVGEMKDYRRRGGEKRTWKVPGLRRSGSLDSEMGLTTCSEEEDEEGGGGRGGRGGGRSKRLRRKLKRRVRSRSTKRLTKDQRSTSTGSLIDLHKELTHQGVDSVHLWLGKDYVNWITRDLYDPHIPFNDSVNRHETPRMPWHDVSLYVEGPAGRDAARHFIQRWNAVKDEKTKNNDRYPFLLPKTYQPSSFVPSSLKLKHQVKCQVVRSLGNWSGGVCETERSIYNAYVDAIQSARHYIYIENQFFISSAGGGSGGASPAGAGGDVVNSLARHLFERIQKACRLKQRFRVYVVLPLLPAFEGQVGTPGGMAMQYILHYTYQTIVSGPNSLIGLLSAARITWPHYLSFCSLRTHDLLEGKLVSELIYVHSKLMIVDDRLVIAGSANINDRSMLGSRDSEVNLVIEDEEFTRGTMDGKEYRRGKFAGSLRMYLFSEHLGVSEGSSIDVSDPVCEDFFVRTWQGIASRNTKIYDDVFSCIPCDSATTFAELKRLRNGTNMAKTKPEKAKEKLKKIQGRLVLYPLRFLKDEALKPGPTHKEYLLPVEMWI